MLYSDIKGINGNTLPTASIAEILNLETRFSVAEIKCENKCLFYSIAKTK